MARLGLNYSKQARKDVHAMLVGTARDWGIRQMHAYATYFEKVVDNLREYPKSGQNDRSIPKSHRLYHFGSHTIIYRLRSDEVFIIRVLHQAMSVSKHV